MTIKTEITVITPEVAKAWLDQNRDNRTVSGRIVAKYARDMKAGNWMFTGDPIRFDSNRRLIDGQHRLMAAVQCSTSFKSSVVYGLPPETQEAIDLGKNRSFSDTISLRGMHNTKKIQAVLRNILFYSIGETIAPSTAQLLIALESHPGVPWSVKQAINAPASISISMVAFLHYAGSKLDQDRADAFASVWCTGVPDYPDDPAQIFRDRLMRGTTRIEPDHKKFTMIHVWNLFRHKKTAPGTLVVRTRPVEIEGLPPLFTASQLHRMGLGNGAVVQPPAPPARTMKTSRKLAALVPA